MTKLVFLNDATDTPFYFKVEFTAETLDDKKTMEFKRINNLEACEMIEAGREHFKDYLV